jgi:cyclohexyl-isocyanide hydratase
MLRWIYHLTVSDPTTEAYAPESLRTEGFVHGSYRDAVAESARLYFPASAVLRVLRIDPRRLDVPVEIAETPRGPMPHIHGPVPRDAIREVLAVGDVARAPDEVRGTRFLFVAFQGMTLLDLVGVHDVLARVGRMGIDPEASFEVVSLTDGAWNEHGASFVAPRAASVPTDADVLVVPGGTATRALVDEPSVVRWLKGFPENRLKASVCTGALLLGAAGFLRGRRATTHASALGELPRHGATHEDARVVHDRSLITGGGVTAAIDVGLYVVRLLYGAGAADRIAAQMEWPTPSRRPPAS